MPTDCRTCLLRQRPCFHRMSESEVAFMDRFKIDEIAVPPGGAIQLQGHPTGRLYTVLSGMGLRSLTLEDGRRQVVNFALPGDLIGLNSALTGEARASAEATTPMRLCVFDRHRLWGLFRDHPERAFALTWAAAQEEHFLGEALATLGQRTATEAVAWALAVLDRRLHDLGMDSGGSVPLPYRQQDLADALGLSLVHTNKTLAALRARGLADWRGGRLTVPDREALETVAKAPEAGSRVRPIL